jgi:succinate dehydrogenase/fumarate reductase cytochrome b subunit
VLREQWPGILTCPYPYGVFHLLNGLRFFLTERKQYMKGSAVLDKRRTAIWEYTFYQAIQPFIYCFASSAQNLFYK